MKVSEKIEQLREWLEAGDHFQINDDKDFVLDDHTKDGYLSFDTDIDSVEIEAENVETLEWLNESDNYGVGPYCHVIMKDGQGYEFRSFTQIQRPAPGQGTPDSIEILKMAEGVIDWALDNGAHPGVREIHKLVLGEIAKST